MGMTTTLPDEYPVAVNPDVLGVSSYLKGKRQLIVVWPNPILSQECKDVTVFDDILGQLLMDLSITMQQNNGVGLAAPQVGNNLNVFVVDTDTGPLALINPTISEVDDTYQYPTEEGCLSVPGYFERRERAQRVVVQYKDMRNRTQEKEFQGMLAFAVQHEMDHLKGKVFVDGLSPLKKSRIKTKIKKTLTKR